MNAQIVNYINEETNVEMLEEKTTKEIAQEFGMTVKDAYNKLNSLFEQKLINKLEPVNGAKFDYCGWIRLKD